MARKKSRKKARKSHSKRKPAKRRKSRRKAGSARGKGVVPPKVVMKRVRALYNNRKNPAWRAAMNAVVK